MIVLDKDNENAEWFYFQWSNVFNEYINLLARQLKIKYNLYHKFKPQI